MNFLYALAKPFVGHAERALAIAAIALVLAGLTVLVRRRRIGAARTSITPTPLLVFACCWLLFAACEAEAKRERADIRVDLLFSWPALCVATALCAFVWLRGLLRHGRELDES